VRVVASGAKKSVHYNWSTGYFEYGMRVAQFIRTHPDEIESGWEKFAKAISSFAPDLSASSLRDHLREILVAMGSILQTLALKPGQRLLEYGVGEGGIALEAAKCGIDVTVVDIEQRYLSLIDRRAKMADVEVKTVLGEFGALAGSNFDVVLFYEAFHHSLDHMAVAKKITTMLAPGGRLILAGEPVIGPHNEHWRSSVPFPWGLRMDGLSYRAIKTYGWMELGFDHNYLMEMLGRAGYSCEFLKSAATDRANCYVARPCPAVA